MNGEAIKKAFHLRAQRLRYLALSLLVGIFALLGAGSWVFISAAQITNADVSTLSITSETVNEFDKRRDELVSAFGQAITEIKKASDIHLSAQEDQDDRKRVTESIAAMSGLAVTMGSGTVSDFTERDLQGPLSLAIQELAGTKLNSYLAPQVMESVTKALGAVRAEADREEHDRILREAKASQSEKTGTASSLYLFIPTQVTRFGTLLIVIFLVNILVTLYRYNIRLAAFYDARGDAVAMLGADAGGRVEIEGFAKLVKELSPEAYDFGKMPRSPVDHAVDLAKEVIAKLPVKPV